MHPGLALTFLLLAQQPVYLTPDTTVGVIVDGHEIDMPLSQAQAEYDQLVTIQDPSQQEIHRLAALRQAIGLLRGIESCEQGKDPSCRVLPSGYRLKE